MRLPAAKTPGSAKIHAAYKKRIDALTPQVYVQFTGDDQPLALTWPRNRAGFRRHWEKSSHFPPPCLPVRCTQTGGSRVTGAAPLMWPFPYRWAGIFSITTGSSMQAMKWSTKSGHRVKAVKCHKEVRNDNRNEKETRVYGRFQAGV